jgi:hypothetical protein
MTKVCAKDEKSSEVPSSASSKICTSTRETPITVVCFFEPNASCFAFAKAPAKDAVGVLRMIGRVGIHLVTELELEGFEHF